MSFVPEGPALPLLGLEGPRRQSRLSIGFRIILAIPHLIYAALLGIVLFFAVIAAWFGALALGRLPDGLATFIGRVLQYVTRVQAYGELLLTDRYPPFALDADDYSIAVLLPPPGRLNRAAVLFRFILLLPAMFVVQLLTAGLGVVMFFVWVIALIAGQLPRSIWEALAAILRYQVRAYAFAIMLTSEYPRGLFGDRPDAAATATDAATADPFGTAPPRVTRLALSTAAKRIIVLVLVIGAVSTLARGASMGDSRDDRALVQVEAAHGILTREIETYSDDVQGCALDGGPECLARANRGLSAAFDEFEAFLVNDVSLPATAVDAAQDLEETSADLSDLLQQLADATDEPARYQAIAGGFQRSGAMFDDQYEDLRTALRFG